MPLRFRCDHCRGLMAISSRQVGAVVACPKCGKQTLVPAEDAFSLEISQPGRTVEEFDVSETDSNTQSEFIEPAPDEELSQPTRQTLFEPSEFLSEATAEEHLGEPVDEPFVPDEIGGDDDGELPLTIRRHNHLDDEMDLTPMVDVTFQLLIFFMVSASFSLQKTIEVPTPDPDQKGASQQVQTVDDLHGTSIIVKIDASNTIWIDDEPLSDVLRLADTLRDKMRREQKTELLVTADNQSLHRTVISVIDAANEVGMQKIRMTSKKKMD